MKTTITTIILFLLSCSTTEWARMYSQGKVPCPGPEIAISGYTSSPMQASWTATCRGRDYLCAHTTGSSVSCSPVP